MSFTIQFQYNLIAQGSAPSSGVTQEVLGPFLEGEKEQSGG
jgi:hypothetical protein